MPVKIQVTPNGPLLVTGEVELVDAEGRTLPMGTRRAVALCRCGNSARKPFCDGTHSRACAPAEPAAAVGASKA